jgi:hypothetical protein
MSDAFESEQIGGITCHTFKDSSEKAVDEWTASFHAYMESTPADRPFYYLFDISGEDVYFTPYARETAAELFSAYRNRQGYMAFIMVWVTGPHIAKLFFSSLGRLTYKVEYFNTAAEGLQWLRDISQDR